jgi:AP-1 complex subunit gamma-1
MSIKLRDLIRAVRACKTAAEERAVISKECALIRTAIKEEDETFRHRNVAKLMYIHMLGYPTHFGQMECLKLISASGFPEKRIGYLALTLLLTEQTEVLTLVTNSLKVDLTNSNQYIQALSLITIGNLATQDMARDLAFDVEKLLKSTNAYLRKKASLATIRLLKKEPDLIETVGERIIALLKDRSHGVLISALQLMIDVLDLIPSQKEEYLKLVPSLVRLLRNFISMGFSPEHDVSGITDPFMQVKLLNLLRLLGKENEEASEQMNDVLAQVATNTESSKNAGNAILYECVQTIMEVESDSGLKVLAVNILGRFLLNRDNNIRYVALNSLSRVVSDDIAAVQRHRNTIVDCLKDTDVSIRTRALELIYQLVNESNVVSLTTELLNYLVVVGSDQKAALVSKITQIVERYSPSPRWRVDTIITMLTLAGSVTEDSVPRIAVMFIASAQGLQGYAVHQLFRALQEDTSQQALLHVAIWCIGEYGDSLIVPSHTPADAANGSDAQSFSPVSEDDILSLLDKCTKIHNSDSLTKGLVLNALMKLTIRFRNPSSKTRLMNLVAPFRSSMVLELQQRANEYSMLMTNRWDSLRGELVGAMPVMDEATMRKKRGAFEDDGSATPGSSAMSPVRGISGGFAAASLNSPAVTSSSSGMGSSLLDLDDIFGGGAISKTPAAAPRAAAPVSSFGANDLLADIFGGGAPAPAPAPQMMQTLSPTSGFPPTTNLLPMNMGMGGGLGMTLPMAPSPMAAPMPAPVPLSPFGASNNGAMGGFGAAPAMTSPSNPAIKAFDKNGFQVLMEVSKPNLSTPNISRILVRFNNLTPANMDNLVFQAAVPKYLKLDMQPATSTTVPGNTQGVVSQEIRVTNSNHGEKPIMLKLKLGYSQNGATVSVGIPRLLTVIILFGFTG